MRHASRGFVLSLAGLVLIWAGYSQAQSEPRSKTGRSKPRAEAPVQDSTSESEQAEESVGHGSPWSVAAYGGLVVGGSLFHVDVLNGSAIEWTPPGGRAFSSSSFTATLDQDFGFGISVARALGPRWSIHGDLDWAAMDITAEALLGQDGGIVLYDRYNMLTVGLGTEIKLASARTYPFAILDLVLTRLVADGDDALSNTRLGGRVGLGFQWDVDTRWSVRLAARLTAMGYDLGDYQPPTSQPTYPVVEYQVEDNLMIFDLRLGVATRL